ncbi:MAG TPA: DNA-binding protein, partial [Kaistiaceae bacterium]|nr:DNA-binding protein [Kaistiaceae bacterium]
AERLLADTGWLPEPLRLASLDGEQANDADAQTEGGDDTALPDFLAEDGDKDDAADAEDEETVLAAE